MTDTATGPARFSVQLASLLAERGSIEHDDVVGYLAALTGHTRDRVRDGILDEAAEGTVHITWDARHLRAAIVRADLADVAAS